MTDEIRATFAREYASLDFGDATTQTAFGTDADFDRDVDAETGGVK